MRKGKAVQHQKQTMIIDCQVFQTASWHRGMGKYSRALLEELLNDKSFGDSYTPYLLFTDKLPIPQEIEGVLERYAEKASVLRLPLELPKEPRNEFSIEPTRKQNSRILQNSLHERFNDQYDFLILALYLDEVCPVFPKGRINKKALVYYDSIPYLYHERYNAFAGFFNHFYFPHTATVYEADKVLCISETVANDLRITFGLPAERLSSINGAAIPRQHLKASQPAIADLQPSRYILMNTGQELRKNNKRAIEAFERFNNRTNAGMQLVITSTFSEESRQELGALSKNVVFTGNVSEGELKWLYDNCVFLVFPSEYEGLGLPVLEAIESKKSMVCSNISVFREISTDAFKMFDPLDIDDMADTIQEMYEGISLPDVALYYPAIAEKYTWHNTVGHLIDALASPLDLPTVVKKPRIAIFCPEPSGFSAIGKVVIESHAWYSTYFDVTYYFDKGPNHKSIRPNPLPALADCRSVEEFSEHDYETYDAVIYHVGNSEYHLNTIHTALVFPGYVILHDTFLRGAYDNLLELGYITEQRFRLEEKLDKLIDESKAIKQPECSFLTSLVNNQKGVVTHSEYAKRAVESRLVKEGSNVLVRKVDLPVATPLFADIVHPKSNQIIISFAGILASVKGTDIMENIAVSDEFTDCVINIFGYSAVEPDQIARLKQLPHVNLITSPSDFVFQNLMATSDILINVRHAYKGETSLTTLEAMRFGVDVLVRDFGWYSELPDDAVTKIGHPELVLETLKEIVSNPDKRHRIRHEALHYIEKKHTHQQYAQGMASLISQTT